MPTKNRTSAHRKEVAQKVGRPPKYRTPQELGDAFEAYFTRQDEQGRPYTIAGLCLAAGFSSRQSLYDYAGKDEFVDCIKRARLRIEEHLNEKLLAGQGTVAGPIFALKNTFPDNWKDKHETEITGSGGGPLQLAAGLAHMPPRPKDMGEWSLWYQQAMAEADQTVAIEPVP